MEKSLVLVILGPTSSGKSDLAVKLALEFGGEIISADSRQVYRGLDIGSGKITKKERRGVPHYLLDVADPRERFSVAEYQKLAQEKIAEINARKKLPIICGGTGFYIQAVVDGLVLPPVPPNPQLRAELAQLTTSELFAKLKKLDSTRAAKIDAQNSRRLIRAIEIVQARVPLDIIKGNPCSNNNFSQIGLNPPPTVLRQKIHARLLARLENGLVEEVKKLHGRGISWQRLEELGLEYRYVARYLQNKLNNEEMTRQLELAIWHYAKRQMTWFKRDSRIRWFVDADKAYQVLRQEKLESRLSPKANNRSNKRG